MGFFRPHHPRRIAGLLSLLIALLALGGYVRASGAQGALFSWPIVRRRSGRAALAAWRPHHPAVRAKITCVTPLGEEMLSI